MDDNYIRNQVHYTEKYSRIVAEELTQKLGNFEAFFEDATQTDTSWAGTYSDDFAARVQGAQILELGCGNGLNSLVMLMLGASKVVAVDLAVPIDLIEELATKFGCASKLDVREGDFERMDFELSSFDLVVGKSFLHHLTHEQEDRYLEKAAALLVREGQARFFEPCTNSGLLSTSQYLIPVPGRPSRLNKRAFQSWLERKVEPDRDNSSSHYTAIGRKYFAEVEIAPIGSIERFHRLLPAGTFNRKFRRLAEKLERRFPLAVQRYAARSQAVIYRMPLRLFRPEKTVSFQPRGALPAGLDRSFPPQSDSRSA
jgi:SAM-dependent methyltransferase